MSDANDDLRAELKTETEALVLEQKALRDRQAQLLKEPAYRGGKTPGSVFGGQAPYGTSGPVGRDSAGYSILKAAGFCLGLIEPEYAKEEIETHNRLKHLLSDHHRPAYPGRSFYVPASSRMLPGVIRPDGSVNTDIAKFGRELGQKMFATYTGADPDEVGFLERKLGLTQKAAWVPSLGTTDDTAGGVLVGFPTLGELVDLQRNLEVFSQAGATQLALPANGRLMLPKLTGGATAYNVGEAQAITQSQEKTGSLLLEAKKLGIIVPLNNELIRFVGPSAEAMVRTDMAKVMALKADLDMLQGTGGTQMTGILNLPSTTSDWTVGTDKIRFYTSVGTPADGNSGYPFQPEDINNMIGALPDAVDSGTAWVGRTNWWQFILNRRSDAVTAADGKGVFVFDMWRSIADKRPSEVQGSKLIRSRQVANNRVRGSGSTFTYLLYGYFPDWIISRFGIMEFLANPYDSQSFVNDQIALRGIQLIDAGPRHAASFVVCDALAFA